MSSIREIIKSATAGKTSTVELLRMALVAAKRLGEAEMYSWAASELSGYSEGAPVRDYRRVKTLLEGQNYGSSVWVPIHFDDARVQALLGILPMGHSATKLEDIVLNAKGGYVRIMASQNKRDLIFEALGHDPNPCHKIAVSEIRTVLAAINDHVLEWALDLESRGVLGDGMEMGEATVVEAERTTFNVTNNIGVMNNSQLQQFSQGPQTMGGELDLAGLRALMEQVVAGAGTLPKDVAPEAIADAQTVIVQLDSGRPKAGLVSESLQSLQRILENTAGSLAASVLPSLMLYLPNIGELFG